MSAKRGRKHEARVHPTNYIDPMRPIWALEVHARFIEPNQLSNEVSRV